MEILGEVELMGRREHRGNVAEKSGRNTKTSD